LASEILDAFQGSSASSTSNSNSKSNGPTAGANTAAAAAPVDDIYIEDLLLQIMEEEFDVAVEDGSAETVSKDILKIYEEVYKSEGKARDALVKKFEEAAEKSGKGRVDVSIQREDGNVADDDDEDDEEDWEDEDGDVQMEGGEQVPQLIDHQARRREEPEVDEDGFTMVKGRGKGRR
jgi:pre-rRNA-processing protein TSR2